MLAAVAFVTRVAELENVRPPHVSRAVAQPAQRTCGLYSDASRTIRLVDLDRSVDDLIETLLHEFQHYLDDLYGTELRGSLRGRHDVSFYARLDRLRDRVARAAESAMRHET